MFLLAEFSFTLHSISRLGKHTVFGRIKEGMKVVNRIGLVATDANDRLVYCNMTHVDSCVDRRRMFELLKQLQEIKHFRALCCPTVLHFSYRCINYI